jgi:hypothetical protein
VPILLSLLVVPVLVNSQDLFSAKAEPSFVWKRFEGNPVFPATAERRRQ